ncbi:Cd(II)/Pb(II)-responsive transcriptional regulator [Biostraticola tofi]|uniref:Cd(II)/Pb(II)-responsive transcriptional regulator n=1 Tax=Biostraticola tofi TaxID=466109 RepID=A0A4R3YUD5_9GAMM|nr:Cd(II)/Pb(II)-responsive transcriptional regulator [Biostraticola tofi]TCV96695.1 Cd(II)/Pb(II)-responsive transcriptional regulator [Biostraticola tofi]
MKIGELAKQAGCPVETIRYYEREGLIPAPCREAASNYRRYDYVHLERLTFIRRCRALDMTHEEIRTLLAARSDANQSCETINELIASHLRHVQDRLSELKTLEGELTLLQSRCHEVRATRDCGILLELEQPVSAASVPAPASTASHVSGGRCGSHGLKTASGRKA